MSDNDHRLTDAEPSEQPDNAGDIEDTLPENDPDETVERYDTGASVSVDITRGTGTRDQEKWKLKGKGRNAEEALGELETELDELEERLANRVRNIQPEVSDDE
jgi:hypothetical protein